MQKFFVDEHRPGMRIDAQTCKKKKTCTQRVRVPTELPFCTHHRLLACWVGTSRPTHTHVLVMKTVGRISCTLRSSAVPPPSLSDCQLRRGFFFFFLVRSHHCFKCDGRGNCSFFFFLPPSPLPPLSPTVRLKGGG